jgi:hypothetical protein
MNVDKYNLLKYYVNDLETMLEISKEESNLIGQPVRNIDILIHRWDLDNKTIYNIKDFLEHQDYLIAISVNHEREYFNMGSKIKRGDFDPMTDILRACYFAFYSFLLSKNLKYNLTDIDIFISLILGIKFDYQNTTLKLPQSEFDAIKNIIKFFKQKHPDKYNSTWWNNLKVGIINLYDNILPNWEFWIKNPDERYSANLWDRLKELLKLRFERGIWEKHPCYIGLCDTNMTLDKVEDLKRITYLEELFDNPDNKSYINTPNICENKFHKKYLKYKKKYLKLKNKI